MFLCIYMVFFMGEMLTIYLRFDCIYFCINFIVKMLFHVLKIFIETPIIIITNSL